MLPLLKPTAKRKERTHELVVSIFFLENEYIDNNEYLTDQGDWSRYLISDSQLKKVFTQYEPSSPFSMLVTDIRTSCGRLLYFWTWVLHLLYLRIRIGVENWSPLTFSRESAKFTFWVLFCCYGWLSRSYNHGREGVGKWIVVQCVQYWGPSTGFDVLRSIMRLTTFSPISLKHV